MRLPTSHATRDAPDASAGQTASDLVEDVVGVRADQLDGGDANNGDEREHECVLDHRCRFIILDEVADKRGDAGHTSSMDGLEWYVIQKGVMRRQEGTVLPSPVSPDLQRPADSPGSCGPTAVQESVAPCRLLRTPIEVRP